MTHIGVLGLNFAASSFTPARNRQAIFCPASVRVMIPFGFVATHAAVPVLLVVGRGFGRARCPPRIRVLPRTAPPTPSPTATALRFISSLLSYGVLGPSWTARAGLIRQPRYSVPSSSSSASSPLLQNVTDPLVYFAPEPAFTCGRRTLRP